MEIKDIALFAIPIMICSGIFTVIAVFGEKILDKIEKDMRRKELVRRAVEQHMYRFNHNRSN